jgi:hypothetical protein
MHQGVSLERFLLEKTGLGLTRREATTTSFFAAQAEPRGVVGEKIRNAPDGERRSY